MTRHILHTGVLVLLLVLVGCARTGGEFSGVPLPKFVKGTIEGNTYTAQDKSFSVALPHAKGSYEYRYLNIKEQVNDQFTYTSFGPAVLDLSIYRVSLVRLAGTPAVNLSIESLGPRALADYVEQLKAYKSEVTERARGEVTVNGMRAFYAVLDQELPGTMTWQGRSSSYPTTHYFYAVRNDTAFAYIVVQFADVKGMHKKEVMSELHSPAPVDRFVKSFQFH